MSVTTHQTIQIAADGSLVDMDCLCGEDHGPSLREEVLIWTAALKRMTAERDAALQRAAKAERGLGMALRRLARLRTEGPGHPNTRKDLS